MEDILEAIAEIIWDGALKLSTDRRLPNGYGIRQLG